MLHVLATAYFLGMLMVVTAGMAATLADDWKEIRRALRGDRRMAGRPAPLLRGAVRPRRPIRRSAMLRAAA